MGFAEPFRRGEAAGEEADRRRLDIALAAGDLSGKAQPRHGLEPQRRVEQFRRIEERIAVQPAEPGELGLGEAGDGPEDPHLLGMFQLGLEADHVEQAAELVVLAQLHHGVGLDPGLMRIGEAERLHRAVAQRLAAALGHHFDRQAAVEIGRRLFEFVERHFVAGEQRIDEAVVLFARQRTIDVIGAGAGRSGLVVARLKPGDVEIDRVAMHDRRNGIEERQRVFAGAAADRLGKRGEVSGPVATMTLSQSAGGATISLRSISISGSASSAAVIASAKPSRSTASALPAGSLWQIGCAHHQRVEPAHFGMQKADGAALGIVGAERIGADQFGELSGLVHGGRANGPHFVQHRWHAAARKLPGGLGTGEAAADDMNRP